MLLVIWMEWQLPKNRKSHLSLFLSPILLRTLYHANDRNCETPRLGISATSSQHFPPKFEKIGLCCVTTAIPHFYFKHPILYFQVVFNAICISHQWKIHTKPILGTSVTQWISGIAVSQAWIQITEIASPCTHLNVTTVIREDSLFLQCQDRHKQKISGKPLNPRLSHCFRKITMGLTTWTHPKARKKFWATRKAPALNCGIAQCNSI